MGENYAPIIYEFIFKVYEMNLEWSKERMRILLAGKGIATKNLESKDISSVKSLAAILFLIFLTYFNYYWESHNFSYPPSSIEIIWPSEENKN